MKKLFITILSIVSCLNAHGLAVGNPADASLLCDGVLWAGHCPDPCDPCLTWCDAFSLRFGFYGDYVFNRHMELESSASDTIEKTEIYTNAALFAANFWDRFDVFFTLGATNLFITSNAITFGGANGARIEIETETDFSYSVGARGMIWECGCMVLGAEAQYFYSKPHVRRITEGADLSVYPGSNIVMKYQEWQVGMGLSYRINLFVPYLAVMWSHANANMDDARPGAPLTNITLFDLENNNDWSYAVGVSLIDCEKAALTVEARFGGEKAAHVNGQIRF